MLGNRIDTMKVVYRSAATTKIPDSILTALWFGISISGQRRMATGFVMRPLVLHPDLPSNVIMTCYKERGLHAR